MNIDIYMNRTGFENLHVYQLAETLSDIIWNIIIKWDKLAQDTVGKHGYTLLTVLVQILPKAQAGAVSQIIKDLRKLPGPHYLKSSTGLEGL
jgi:hypothetical protein